MSVSPELRRQVMGQAQGAIALQVAFIGIANGLFSQLANSSGLEAPVLAEAAGVDAAYVTRWCEAAYAFGYLEEVDGLFRLSELGQAFCPEAADTLMPFAVNTVLAGHMAERAAGLMRSGDRPGEQVLGERATILPWFGPMLAAQFSGLFEREILTGVPVYREVGERQGLVVDLGCGNGWYLRALARRYTGVRGLGLDGFDENIRQAAAMARSEGLAERLTFRAGDIHHFTLDEPADLIVMNRALHHVWNEKANVFAMLKAHLRPGGAAIIWEPRWPDERAALRDPARRVMAFQNLSEHVQGNHFLRPAEIEAEFTKAGLSAETYLFAQGNEAVIVGRKPLSV